jgi:hypothetical protein
MGWIRGLTMSSFAQSASPDVIQKLFIHSQMAHALLIMHNVSDFFAA